MLSECLFQLRARGSESLCRVAAGRVRELRVVRQALIQSLRVERIRLGLLRFGELFLFSECVAELVVEIRLRRCCLLLLLRWTSPYWLTLLR